MDERLRNGYRRIYSELFTIILYMAAVSMVIKYVFFDLGLKDCVLEYIILVGSPIYMAIRTRMMQIAAPAGKKSTLEYTIAVAVVLIVFMSAVAYAKGYTNWSEFGLSMIAFVAMFSVVRLIFIWINKKRQDKLNSKYDD